MPTFRRTPNSNDVPMPANGSELRNVQPMDESLYDREETGPMFTAESDGFDRVELFEDEIECEIPYDPDLDRKAPYAV